jgi:pyridoxamine 5'-phosphate oxidase
MPDSAPPEPLPDDLHLALDAVWQQLAIGAADRRSNFHTVGLATIGIDGPPELRTVVLRQALAPTWEVMLHTDIRAQKVAEIIAHPQVALLGYCPVRKLQIRLNGAATLHHDDDTTQLAWDRAQPMSRRLYRLPVRPGVRIAHPEATPSVPLDPEDYRIGFESFAMLRIEVTRLEWLCLALTHHRRARYLRSPTGLDATWLVP